MAEKPGELKSPEGAIKFSLTDTDFVNVPPSHSLDSLHKMIAENGGTFSMNLNSSVTHCVAADSKGFKFEAAKRHGDVIHYSWVLDCCSQKKLIPLQPKYFLFLSELTKKKLHEEIDEFSDSYYLNLDRADIKQLLSNIPRSKKDISTIDYYRKKYCPKDKWSHFQGCSIYFHTFFPPSKGDWEVLLGLSLRRLRSEVLMSGGKVTDNPTSATHLVALSVPGYNVDFKGMLTSFTPFEGKFLSSKRLHVVGSRWLEDCLEQGQRLPEQTYTLKPSGIEELTTEECKHDLALDGYCGGDNVEDRNSTLVSLKGSHQPRSAKPMEESLVSLEKSGKRKRGRPVGRGGSKMVKTAGNQTHRSRARIGKRPAKICDYETDESGSHDEKPYEGEIVSREFSLESHNGAEVTETVTSQNPQPSKLLDAVKQEDLKDVEHEEHSVPEIEMTEQHNGQNSRAEQVMADPIQAMLFDMFPSLATEEIDETKNDNLKDDKPQKVVETKKDNVKDDKPPEQSKAEPTRKKKVSYKDVANELLKDW